MTHEKKSQPNGLQEIFTFSKKNVSIRTQVINHEPWFIAQDLCNAIGIGNITDAVKRLDDDEKMTSIQSNSNQSCKMWIVNESGMYSLILCSDRPEAKRFRKWITCEVLPAIRKTGGHSIAQFAMETGFSINPTDCIILSCKEDEKMRNMYLFYDRADNWYGEPIYDMANATQHMFRRIGHFDKKVTEIHTSWYTVRDNRYEKVNLNFRPYIKVEVNPISECKDALERFQQEKERLKETAQRVVEYAK